MFHTEDGRAYEITTNNDSLKHLEKFLTHQVDVPPDEPLLRGRPLQVISEHHVLVMGPEIH